MDMAQAYEAQALQAPHKVTLEGRCKLAVSGVTDVESFDETMIVLQTSRGTLIIRGDGLHLQMLSLDGGQVAVDGTVDSMIYEEDARKGGFFQRLLG